MVRGIPCCCAVRAPLFGTGDAVAGGVRRILIVVRAAALLRRPRTTFKSAFTQKLQKLDNKIDCLEERIKARTSPRRASPRVARLQYHRGTSSASLSARELARMTRLLSQAWRRGMHTGINALVWYLRNSDKNLLSKNNCPLTCTTFGRTPKAVQPFQCSWSMRARGWGLRFCASYSYRTLHRMLTRVSFFCLDL